MAYYTIPQYIRIGDATTFLMANYQQSGALFGKKLFEPQSPVLIAIVTDAIRFEYEGNPTNSTLDGTCNYLLWLCGKFQLEAQTLTGGGSVTPVPPYTIMPNPIEFTVSGSSFIVTGGSSATIPQFIGYNVIFSRNGIPQTQINTEPSYFTWNKVTGAFTCSPAASVDELFSINPV